MGREVLSIPAAIILRVAGGPHIGARIARCRIRWLFDLAITQMRLDRGVRFTTLGSWTLKKEKDERGAEPDECYVFGEAGEERPPDLAIEVVWTSGRIDKLEVYRKLGVREVWYWRDGALQPYALRDERYEAIEQSEVLEGIDLALLVSFLDRATTYDAIRDYRAALATQT